jgi:AraC-like DNA-binding protein
MTIKTGTTDDTRPAAGQDGSYLTDHHAETRGSAVRRPESFHAVDRESAQRFFDNIYAAGWRIIEFATGSAVTHRRSEAGLITIDEILFEGRISCEIRADDSVVVIQPRDGSLRVGGEPIPTGDAPVIAAEGMPCELRAYTARFTVVAFESKLLRKVVAERNSPAPQQIQFLSSRPRSGAVVRTWHRTLDYVVASFACADTGQQPLVIAEAAQLLAAAMLECFPSNVNSGQDLLANPAIPPTFKGAVSFIQRHAGDGIGINDVAAAVRLTPRAVQYLFRQQLDTTPTEYLRRVRLHRAHQDLIAGDRSTTTVSQIAQRWGFAHTGRFAVLYRETYGQSPHSTLRR